MGIAWLTENKPRYNKFMYRLSRVEGGKDQWKNIQTQPLEKQEEFVATIESYAPGTVPADKISRTKSLTKETEEKLEGEWETWKAAADRDGADVVKDMIDFGTMIAKENPNLPPHSKIKAPYNLIVARVRVKWSSNKRKAEETNHEEHDEPELEALEELETEMANITGGIRNEQIAPRTVATPAVAGADDTSEQNKQKTMSERDKTALAAIRKAHGMFDKNKRKWNADLDTSKRSEYTAGTKPEKDLSDIVGQCESLHSTIMTTDVKTTQGTALTDAELKAVGEATTQLIKDMKEGQKVAGKLRELFTMSRGE